MNINRQKLVELIAEESGLPAESVNSQLSELIKKVEESSEKGKALEIKDFGMFYKSEEGDVTFEPSEELETEVNFRYAGMEPIEIRQSLTTASDVVDTDEDSEDEGLAAYEDIDSVPVPVAPDGDKTGISAGNGFRKTGTSGEAAVFGKNKTEENRDEQAELKSEKNPATALITTFVTLLVIVIGIIILVDTGFFDGMMDRSGANESESATAGAASVSATTESESGPADGLESEPATAGAASVSATTESESGSADGLESEPADEPGPTVSESANIPESPAPESSEAGISEESSPYGLMGSIQMIDTLFYTIVVHSFRDETVAREQAATLEDDGYRAITLHADLNELGQRWRVGIGQFDSIAEAGEAAETLPEGFTDNYFIGIIK